MSIHRHIEVSAESAKGFDDACAQAIEEASRSVRNIKELYVKNMKCIVDGKTRITSYRINAKITFEYDPQDKK